MGWCQSRIAAREWGLPDERLARQHVLYNLHELRHADREVQERVGGERVSIGHLKGRLSEHRAGVDARVDEVHRRADEVRPPLDERPVGAVDPPVARRDASVEVDKGCVHAAKGCATDNPRPDDDDDRRVERREDFASCRVVDGRDLNHRINVLGVKG